MRCGDGSLYTGIATDVARRFAEHQGGTRKASRYLRGRGPLQLVFSKAIGARGLALRVESRLKRLSKSRKERLIELRDLPSGIASREPPNRERSTPAPARQHERA